MTERRPAFADATIRRCAPGERAEIGAIINDGAEAYRGVIPADCWHEPYMPDAELAEEIAAGVVFWGLEHEDRLLGVMGLQDVEDVSLIRHAYVRSAHQAVGVGTALLTHLAARTQRSMLIGTWAAATWAIEFYERHGFALADAADTARLLRRYWTVPDRQIETSVVLTDARWRGCASAP